MPYMEFLITYYGQEKPSDVIFEIIFLTFCTFMVELAIFSLIAEAVKYIKRKRVIKEDTNQIENDFFIEGIKDLEDYDIFTPLKDQEA